jgi:hypothetical protein
MKDLTPMKRYKTILDNFRSHVSLCADIYSLNKAESKSIPYPFVRGDKYETKGVENDFVLIFSSKETKGLSFALSFTYIGKEKEQQTVRGSVKFGDEHDQTRYGQDVSIEQFKLNLSNLNKQLDALKIYEYNEIISTFSEVFLNTPFSLAADLDIASEDMNQLVNAKKVELALKDSEQTLKVASKSLQLAQATVLKEIMNSEAYQEREKIMARLEELDNMLTKKKTILEQEQEIKEKKKIEKQASDVFQNKKEELKIFVNDELLKYPVALRNQIKY